MRGHPLIPVLAHPAWEDFGVVFRHGQTVWIDLTLDEEEMWRQTRKTYRNIIRRLQRDSYKITFDENWERLPRFLDLYNQTLDKVKADELYYFNLDYFIGLRKALGPKIFLCLAEKGGEAVAGGLFTECSGIVQYHLFGSSPEGLDKDATKLMLTYVRSWAKARGNSWFHLGGGVGSEADGLLFFKSGFSPRRATYYTWRMVTNPAIFQAAVRAWEEKAHQKADGPEGFFPPYRAKDS
jgi:lipid II:glycine glycyltransferase (peptidoglycan interpeptide bridge formation enzyme)